MARLSDVQSAALANWWDLAQTAANQGFTATDTVTAASDIAQAAGRSLTFEESTAISVLYGYARRIFNAADALQSADPNAPITPDLMAIPPWARDQQVQNTVPIWHQTFAFTFIDQAGNQVTEFKTSVFDMTFPATVGELLSDVQADAEAMAAKYGVQLVSADLISLLAV